jgi:hypothetical protein
MPTLYAIGAELEAIHRTLVENGGELTPDLELQLLQYEFLEADKVDGYYAVLADLESEAEKFKAEASRMKERADVATRARDRLLENLNRYMAMKGVAELKGILKTVKVVRNGQAPVELLVAEADLPEAFCRITREPNKTAIRQQILAAGEDNGTLVVGGQPIAKLGEKGTRLAWR